MAMVLCGISVVLVCGNVLKSPYLVGVFGGWHAAQLVDLWVSARDSVSSRWCIESVCIICLLSQLSRFLVFHFSLCMMTWVV